MGKRIGRALVEGVRMDTNGGGGATVRRGIKGRSPEDDLLDEDALLEVSGDTVGGRDG
jgi:PII-like signaling protein